MNTTIYTVKRHEQYDAFVAISLAPHATTPVEEMSYESLVELMERMSSKFGEDAQRVSPREFERIVAERQVHSDALIALLENNVEGDLSTCYVYGSSWARIPNAICIPADKRNTGYHTYVATPEPMTPEHQKSYELVFVSKPR